MNRRNGRQIASEERRARHFAPFPYRRMVDGNILYRLISTTPAIGLCWATAHKIVCETISCRRAAVATSVPSRRKSYFATRTLAFQGAFPIR